MAARKVDWREIVVRVLMASVGGYALSYVWAALLIKGLPMDGVDATILATDLAFLLFVGVILRAFAVRSMARLGRELAIGLAIPLILLLSPTLLEVVR